MKKLKISKGYYQAGYRKGFKKNVCVWLINNKLYVKDSTQTPFETDLEGYTMINKIGDNHFYAVGLISEHFQYNK